MADVSITTTNIIPRSGVKVLTKPAGEAFGIGDVIVSNRADSGRLYKANSDDTVNLYRNLAIGLSLSAPVAVGQPANYAGTVGDEIAFGSSVLEQGMIYVPSKNSGKLCPFTDFAALTISNKALTSNVATITTLLAHGYVVGDSVVISGVDSTFNGTVTITVIGSSTTFSYAKVAGNVSSTPSTGGLVYQKEIVIIPFGISVDGNYLRLMSRSSGIAR